MQVCTVCPNLEMRETYGRYRYGGRIDRHGR